MRLRWINNAFFVSRDDPGPDLRVAVDGVVIIGLDVQGDVFGRLEQVLAQGGCCCRGESRGTVGLMRRDISEGGHAIFLGVDVHASDAGREDWRFAEEAGRSASRALRSIADRTDPWTVPPARPCWAVMDIIGRQRPTAWMF